MPLYIGDYLSDTMHLSAEESGAYLHLLMHSWKTGTLPSNSETLRRIAKVDYDRWDYAWSILQAFFKQSSDGAWIQERLEKERVSWQNKKEARSEKAQKGAKARWENATSNAPSIPSSTPQAMLETCPLPSSLPLPVKDKKPSRVKREGHAHPLYETLKIRVFDYYKYTNSGSTPEWDGMEGKNLSMLLKARPNEDIHYWNECLAGRASSDINHAERPGVWLSKLSSYRKPLNAYNRPKENGNGNSKSERAQRNIEDAIRLAGHFEGAGDNGDLPGSGSTASGIPSDPSEKIGTGRLIEGNSGS